MIGDRKRAWSREDCRIEDDSHAVLTGRLDRGRDVKFDVLTRPQAIGPFCR